jgi:hypothetical protein
VYFPAAVAVVSVLTLFGVPVENLLTFGGALDTLSGLIAWWLLAFAGACIYAARAFPREKEVPIWPRKK